jgi:hypothetical protein
MNYPTLRDPGIIALALVTFFVAIWAYTQVADAELNRLDGEAQRRAMPVRQEPQVPAYIENIVRNLDSGRDCSPVEAEALDAWVRSHPQEWEAWNAAQGITHF